MLHSPPLACCIWGIYLTAQTPISKRLADEKQQAAEAAFLEDLDEMEGE